MSNIIPFRITTDQAIVVLEVQSDTSKACNDSEPCTLRAWLHEFQEEGIIDTGVHGHDCDQPGVHENGSVPIALYLQYLHGLVDFNEYSELDGQLLDFSSPSPPRWWQIQFVSDIYCSHVLLHPDLAEPEVHYHGQCLPNQGVQHSKEDQIVSCWWE